MATGSKFSYEGLQNLWIKNGGDPKWAPTMAAIALGAESGGDPNVQNPSGATGIWQILSSAQSAAFNKAHPPASMKDPNANARAAIALLGDGTGISNWGSGTGDAIGTAIQANGSQPFTPEQARQYATQGAPTNATLDSAVTTAGSSPQANVPQTVFHPPVVGANVKNFHGYDLSVIPANQLGNAEKAITDYVANPNAVDKNGLTVAQRISQDFGYTGGWIQKIDGKVGNQVNAALIWASQYLDNSSPASKAQFLSAIQKTNWWQTTSQYQRAWENQQGADPASAHKALQVAQDKVLATANQIGVRLNPSQLNQIANMYAAQAYTPTNTYSSQSGTSQEWLDHAVVAAVTAAGKGGSPSNLMAQGSAGTTGIVSQLFQKYQQVAQQYLMYNPNGKGLLTDHDLMNQVNSALQSYTGTGSSGQIGQFVDGAVNQFTEQMKQQSSRMYPSLAEAIAQGTAPADYVKPQANLIANTLGLDAASIDFTSPQWNPIIATPDPKTGIKTALTQDQILAKITNPNFTFQNPNGQTMKFDNTDTALQMANTVTNGLSSMFGIGGR